MKANAKPFLVAGATAVGAFLAVNVICLALSLAVMDKEGAFRLKFNNGSFYVNDELTGLVWGDTIAVIFMSVVFLTVFFWLRSKTKSAA